MKAQTVSRTTPYTNVETTIYLTPEETEVLEAVMKVSGIPEPSISQMGLSGAGYTTTVLVSRAKYKK